MILCDRQIRKLCTSDKHPPMITPFAPELVSKGLSYGLSSYGYDIRLDRHFREPLHTQRHRIMDPKHHDEVLWETVFCKEPYYILAGNSWVLGSSVESFNMPENVIATCLGKSTYARVGIAVNVTPLEPGWSGRLAIEIINTGNIPVKLYPDEGIAQLLFYKGNYPQTTYADRKGKYQNQSVLQHSLTIEE